jgi:hypothetical protein
VDLFQATRVDEYGFGAIAGGDLQKALAAGAGTDSANMQGGRALIPQDIESTLVSALFFKRQDFKLMNKMKTQKATSTVHEYTRRNEVGDESGVFVPEGGQSRETNQNLERVTRVMKFLQTYRELTLQMQVADTLENAEASEKEAGTLTVLKGAEWGSFHGDGDVVPTQFDSVVKQVLSNNSRRNIVDLRGSTMTSSGAEDALSEIARMVYENGGYLSDAFMPPVISQDLQTMARDRFRLNDGDRRGGTVIQSYPTAFSNEIAIAGETAGADKFFRVKMRPITTVGVEGTPGAPTFALAAVANTGSPGFLAATDGTYRYTVFPINDKGIGPAATAANLAVANGEMARVTITPNADGLATGYIVCRGKVGVTTGDDQREMVRVADSGAATTVVDDANESLPGTGQVLLISDDAIEKTIQWDQFLPLMKFDLYPARTAVIPFLIVLFGTPDVKVPWFHGVIDNVGYTGLDWF